MATMMSADNEDNKVDGDSATGNEVNWRDGDDNNDDDNNDGDDDGAMGRGATGYDNDDDGDGRQQQRC